MKKQIILALFFSLLLCTRASAVARAWVGVGAGGAGTDFNTAANWSPAAIPGAADALTITFNAGSGTITLSAPITIGSLVMSVQGNRTGILDVNGRVLTVNGIAGFAASFNAVNYTSVVNYSLCEVLAGASPGGYVFNGTVQFHTTGSGDTYIGAPAASQGSMTFNSDVTVGAWAYTNPTTEPDWIFNKAGTQTCNYISNYHFKPASFTIGTTNSPTVNVTGTVGTFFDVYDGFVTVNNASIFDIGDFDFDPWVAGVTITTNSTSKIRIGNDDNFPGYGVATANPTNYSTYSIGATSTIEYYGGVGQSVSDLANPGYGHLLYTGAGTKTANGSFSVRGNWTNNSTYAHNNSTVTFNGGVNETVGGTSATTFYNMTVANAAGTLFMGVNNNQVNNVCAIGISVVDLNGFTLIINNSALAALTSTTGYIISETNAAANPSIIQWNASNVGGSRVIPFGVSGVRLPLTINITAAMAAASNFKVATRATATTSNTPWSTSVTHMYDPTLAQDGSDEAVIDRWWDFTFSTAATATLTFSYRGSENTLIVPYNAGNLGAQYWSGAWLPNNATIGSSPAVLAGVGTVTAAGVAFVAATFTPMVLSSTTAPLPVELVTFTANCNGTGHELLNWSTASETNNDYFAVERSDDGYAFTDIGRVDGHGTTSQTNNYSFSDPKPVVSTTTYYRLRQTDFNGQTSKSPIVIAESCETNQDVIQSYSSGSDINVVMNLAAASDYTINIFDSQGRNISSKVVTASEGANRFEFTNVIPSTGIYLVSIVGKDGKPVTNRLFITKE